MDMAIESEILAKNCHGPKEKLSKYLSEKSRLMRKKEELELRMESKKELTKKEMKELQYIESKSRTLKNTKREILDEILFPAMADLTFFFYTIAQYPELESIFKTDIWDLLGIRRLDPKPHLVGGNYAYMFDRLVSGILNFGLSDNDYRIRLVNLLQELIRLKLYGPKILDTDRATGLVYGDIGRAQAWTELLASRVPDIYDFGVQVTELRTKKNSLTEEQKKNVRRLLKNK